MLRAIPKIGTRERHWLIVNEHGGWFDEYVGAKANAEAFAVECQKLVDARNAESAASRNVVYGCGARAASQSSPVATAQTHAEMLTDSHMLTPKQIGTRLARKIFECGDEEKDKVQRLQMKGGKWPDNETNLGGYCESALADYIATLLDTDEDFR